INELSRIYELDSSTFNILLFNICLKIICMIGKGRVEGEREERERVGERVIGESSSIISRGVTGNVQCNNFSISNSNFSNSNFSASNFSNSHSYSTSNYSHQAQLESFDLLNLLIPTLEIPPESSQLIISSLFIFIKHYKFDLQLKCLFILPNFKLNEDSLLDLFKYAFSSFNPIIDQYLDFIDCIFTSLSFPYSKLFIPLLTYFLEDAKENGKVTDVKEFEEVEEATIEATVEGYSSYVEATSPSTTTTTSNNSPSQTFLLASLYLIALSKDKAQYGRTLQNRSNSLSTITKRFSRKSRGDLNDLFESTERISDDFFILLPNLIHYGILNSSCTKLENFMKNVYHQNPFLLLESVLEVFATFKEIYSKFIENSILISTENDQLLQKEALNILSNEIFPNLKSIYSSDLDKIINISSFFDYHLLNKLKDSDEQIKSEISQILIHLSKIQSTIKVWKKQVWDYFLDSKLDASSVLIPVINAIALNDRDRIAELVARVTVNPSAANLFSSKEAETLNRIHFISKLSLVIFIGAKDQHLSFLPLIQEKIVELLKLPVSQGLCHVYPLLRIVLQRFDTQRLVQLFPNVFHEIFTFFKNISKKSSLSRDDLDLFLEQAKFIQTFFMCNSDVTKQLKFIFVSEIVKLSALFSKTGEGSQRECIFEVKRIEGVDDLVTFFQRLSISEV
ncbi:hypothetical protein ROZALSC1DRAFT_24692, partial [Rozella allomycis CSF55]